jgi:hypothetical protein
MARDTKVGLLVGMGVILLIGIILSDHLSVASHQKAVDLTNYGPQAQSGIASPSPAELVVDSSQGNTPGNAGPTTPAAARRDVPLPMPNENATPTPANPGGGSVQPLNPGPIVQALSVLHI